MEKAQPNRRFLIRLAVWRFVMAGLFFIVTATQFSRPAFDAPGRWLFFAYLWLAAGLAFFFAAIYPLCFLTRPMEFYENGISFHTFEIPLERLECVRWKQEPFRLLGIFVLPLPLKDRMICVYRTEGKQRHREKATLSGYYFLGLREAFDSAYSFSVPWEFVPWKCKKKPKPVPPPVVSFIGPPVPPMPSSDLSQTGQIIPEKPDEK